MPIPTPQSIPPPNLFPLVTLNLFSKSVNHFCSATKFICIHFLDSTYKWYHMIFVFVWFTSLNMMFSRSIHVAANGNISLFFCDWVIFHCMYIPCLLYPFIYCITRHLGCFRVLAVVNGAAMNIGVHVFFWIRFFSGYMPRLGIAGSYDKCFQFFKELPYCLP